MQKNKNGLVMYMIIIGYKSPLFVDQSLLSSHRHERLKNDDSGESVLGIGVEG